jgi:predicted CoA-binding protein
VELLSQVAMESALGRARRIAVLGIKPESRAGRPAADIPVYLQEAGYEVIPVPVYYPEETTMLGVPVVRDLRTVPSPVDILDVFRRPRDVPGHVEDILALRPGLVWFQSGCLHRPSAARLLEAGIPVCHDCIYVVHRRMR